MDSEERIEKLKGLAHRPHDNGEFHCPAWWRPYVERHPWAKDYVGPCNCGADEHNALVESI